MALAPPFAPEMWRALELLHKERSSQARILVNEVSLDLHSLMGQAVRLPVYLDDRYDALVDALVNVPPCPVTGERTADKIKLVLCEFDIWPKSIRAEVIRAMNDSGDTPSNVVRL